MKWWGWGLNSEIFVSHLCSVMADCYIQTWLALNWILLLQTS